MIFHITGRRATASPFTFSNLLLFLALLLIATPGKAQLGDTVATLDGQAITMAQLENFAAAALDNLAQQRHKILEQGLAQLLDQHLLELEAKRRGIRPETLIETELASHGDPVSDAEVDAWYTANQSRLRQPKEVVADQVRAYLEQQRVETVRTDLLTRLRQSHRLEVLLEPLRLPLDLTSAQRKGSPSAPVTLTLFSDFQCPACRRINPIVEQVRETYGEKVQVAFEQYPLVSIHPQAFKAAEAALCAADQGQFWPMHDALFAAQQELGVEQLKERAARLGLDQTRFDTCLDDDAQRDAVARDMAAGRALGLSSTPSLFVNGRPVELGQGGSPFDNLKTLIDDELRRQGDAS